MKTDTDKGGANVDRNHQGKTAGGTPELDPASGGGGCKEPAVMTELHIPDGICMPEWRTYGFPSRRIPQPYRAVSTARQKKGAGRIQFGAADGIPVLEWIANRVALLNIPELGMGTIAGGIPDMEKDTVPIGMHRH